MSYRKLRIAWSVVWGLVAVLLIVLWVRSHYSVDQIFLPTFGSAFVTIASAPDAILVGMSGNSPTATWAMLSMPSDEWRAALGEPIDFWPGIIAFKVVDEGVIMPHWFGALLLAALAAAPWMRRRFTLRTLLIAMTLIAIVLGVFVYESRWTAVSR